MNVALALPLALFFSADPPAEKNPTPPVIKNLKEAVADAADGGVHLVNGIDISKLPFNSDSVKKIVVSFQPQIQTCYEETLAGKKKAVEGKLKTSFVIGPEGYVTKAAVNPKLSTLKDAKLHDCVVAVLSAMTFPKPADGKSHPIDFPFNLKAQR